MTSLSQQKHERLWRADGEEKKKRQNERQRKNEQRILKIITRKHQRKKAIVQIQKLYLDRKKKHVLI